MNKELKKQFLLGCEPSYIGSFSVWTFIYRPISFGASDAYIFDKNQTLPFSKKLFILHVQNLKQHFWLFLTCLISVVKSENKIFQPPFYVKSDILKQSISLKVLRVGEAELIVSQVEKTSNGIF